MRELETIAQVVTAPGKGAVGIVRISGEAARAIGDALYEGRARLSEAESHTIHYGWVRRPDGTRIDEALFMTMWAPRTYTGEDVVEIQCHGGTVATQEVLRAVLEAGAVPAEAGEFSRRAYLNGKLDLTRAEAIMDLVEAKNATMLQLAAAQKHGLLETKIEALREELLALIAYLQADIDFPEDDIERLDVATYGARAEDIMHELRSLIASGERGRIYKEGITLAIAGRPNVGKSSLTNALLGRQAAIVTDIPGTTRDVLRNRLTIGGLSVELLDTAGLRETADPVEAIGVALAEEAVQEADYLIYVLDGTRDVAPEDLDFLARHEAAKVLLVENKADLYETPTALPAPYDARPVLRLSAKTGEGMAELERAVAALALAGTPETDDSFYVTNLRHLTLLEGALADMDSFRDGMACGISADFAVIDLQHAWVYLGLIVGAVAEDDLMNEIFSRFCLGK